MAWPRDRPRDISRRHHEQRGCAVKLLIGCVGGMGARLSGPAAHDAGALVGSHAIHRPEHFRRAARCPIGYLRGRFTL